MDNYKAFEGWAIVEQIGHKTLAGYVSERTIAGVAMLQVDVPAVEGTEKYTKFLGGGTIYGITPTTQEIAERAAARLQARPVDPYLVLAPQRPALVDSTTAGLDEQGHEEDPGIFVDGW